MEETPATTTGKRLFILLAVLVLLGIAVGGMLALKSSKISYVSDEKDSSVRQLALSIATANILRSEDDDNDGLKNWEEVLWSTDKNNPDSDGDGTNDGDEIEAGRDPTRPAPDDALADTTSLFVTSKSNDYGTGGLTETDKFTQKFFTSYIYQRGNLPLTAASQDVLVAELVKEVPNITVTFYDATDLSNIITGDPTEESLRDYGNGLGNILITYGSPNVEYELDILTKVLAEESEEELANLDLIIESHQTVIANYLVMPVPAIAVPNHLGYINAFSALEASISALRKILDDPVVSLGGIKAYPLSINEMTRQFIAMGTFLSENNLEFNVNEGGYLFTNFGSYDF